MYVKRFALAFVLVLSVCMVQAFSQEDGWYYGRPISVITFKGLKNIKSRDMDGITSSYIGKKFDDEVFADLLNRVFALNYFEDVEPEALPGDEGYKTVKIQINVVEYPIVKKLKFTGYRRLRPADMKEVMLTKENGVYREENRIEDEATIRNLCISKGYSEATVTSSATLEEDGYIVTFHLKEGKQVVVKDIIFTGNHIASARTLKNKLTSKKVGVLNRRGYQEAAIEQDKLAILKYYYDNGYVDAQIINVTQETEYNAKKERQEVTIQFNISEGSQYTFGGIKVEGNKVFKTEELVALVKLKVGAVFNMTRFQEGFGAIQSKYYDNGYLSARTAPQEDKNTNTKVLSYTVYIQEGMRGHVESITIKGNTRTKEEVIRREIPIESGDIFSQEKVSTAFRNLYNLQYFSQVVPEMKPGSEDNLVDLTFTVEEQSTRSIQFGLTFSGTTQAGEFPIALFASLQDTNISGSGKTAGISTTVSTKQQSVSLNYGQSWLWGLPISNSMSVGYTHSTLSTARNVFLPDGTFNWSYYYMTYTEHRLSFSDTISRHWTPNFATVTLSAGFNTNLINNVYDGDVYVPAESIISDYHGKWNPKNSIFTQLSLDGRDYFFDASKGWFLSQRFTWFGLMPRGKFIFPENFGETEFYLRSTTTAEKYFTLIDVPLTDKRNFKTVLMGSSQLTMQRPFFDSSIRKTSQLYFDGMFQARGWEIYSEDEGRGNLTWTNSLELRIPVFPNAISFDFIFDAAMIKSRIKDIKTYKEMNDWYFSFGPGLRLTMQQLPLRMLFVSNFKMEDGQIAWKDADGDRLHSLMSAWHFVLTFNSPNR